MADVPTEQDVLRYRKKWRDSRFWEEERVLDELFCERMPQNTSFEEVLIKISAMDALYSTMIKDADFVPLAEAVCEQGIDERLQAGELKVVEELVEAGRLATGTQYCAFATKYCSFHKPDHYSICDSVVRDMLWHMTNWDYSYFGCTKEGMTNYLIFHKCMDEFMALYGLQEFSRREIDRYLWLKGKGY